MDTEYLYASTCVRARENGLLGADKMNRMIEARTEGEVYAMLAEYGIPTVTTGEGGPPDREATLSTLTEDAFSLIREVAPEPELFSYLRLPYDGNNLKSALKCAFRGIDPSGMLFSCGTVPQEAVVRAVREKNYDVFAPALAAGARAAEEAYVRSRDPQALDMLVDHAVYTAMLACTEREPFLHRLVQVKVDLTNLLTLLRLLRRRSHEGVLLWQNAYIGGGTLPYSFFVEVFQTGEAGRLGEALAYGAYAGAFGGLDTGAQSLEALERACDDHYMAQVRQARMVPFGAPVLAGYLIAREYEVKNLRILLGGKAAGLAPDALRVRMRRAYV